MQIPRPGAASGASGVGLIFVKFTGPPEATNAKNNLQGRTFGGRAVQVHYYPVDKFDAGVLEDVSK